MMHRIIRFGGSPLVLVLALVAAALPCSARAQEESTKEAADKGDTFTIPEGDAKEIAEFIDRLANTAPEGETDEEQLAFGVKALETLSEAADRLLAAEPTDSQAADAFEYKINALQALTELGENGAAGQLDKAIAAAIEDDRERINAIGWQSLIGDRRQRWDELDAAARQEFHDRVIAKIEADGVQPLDASIVEVASLGLENRDEAFVAKLLESAVPLLKMSDDKEVQAVLEKANLDGMLRRLTLLGNPMQIDGELLGGGEVDWDSYRGKVVLVDFWATWCGPCRQELPNVLAMYEAYHEKGFEVLGVSLDTKPERAKEFIDEAKIPWGSIFPADEEQREWNHPLVKYYGISGVPTAILVDKEGKVVHMEARGEQLREQLQHLLGDPIEKPDADEPEAGEPASAGGDSPSLEGRG